MRITLRPYQEKALKSVLTHLETRRDNPCVVIPTGGGKTPVMAALAREKVAEGRVLILAHVKELLQQTADKLRTVCPEVDFGVYSAGLGRRDTKNRVVVAGIQSVFKKASVLGEFALVIVDEAHLIPPDGEGMYRRLIADLRSANPFLRVVGFTATPFRTKSGPLCTAEGILNRVCYEVGVSELVRNGFLCPLTTKAGKSRADLSEVPIRAGEFVSEKLESAMADHDLVRAACEELVEKTRDRNSVLVFATGVEHAHRIVCELRERHSIECGLVDSNTASDERKELIERFRGAGSLLASRLKFLANVNVLTTGFDAPNVDCVAMLRPTMSPGLYYQMVGRGFRVYPSKKNCLVLDFGGNALRHGPVDELSLERVTRSGGPAPAKECPQCQSVISAGYAACPECGFQFPPRAPARHLPHSLDATLLAGTDKRKKYEVVSVTYSVHVKRRAPIGAPKSMRVEYRVGWKRWFSEWVCFEHTGWAREKAVAWWRARSELPVPRTASEAVQLAQHGKLAGTITITVDESSRHEYPCIVDYELEPRKSLAPAGEEVPF